MKYLLIVLAILMLGCGTDTEVIEEPPPIAEEPEPVTEAPAPVAEEPPPIVEHPDDLIVPNIIASNVFPENRLEVGTFDPVPLNQDGIFFDFDQHVIQFEVDLSLDGKSLGWLARAMPPEEGINFSVKLTPPAAGPFLEHDKEHLINVIAVARTGVELQTEIRFRTIPKP